MKPVLPDAEVLLVAFLAGHPQVSALVDGPSGPRVGTHLDSKLPAIRVTRTGGTPPDYWEDAPDLQVEAWADTQDEASVLVRTVIAALEEIDGEHPEGAVRGHEVTLGPVWSPDFDTDQARYLVGLSLLTYAHT